MSANNAVSLVGRLTRDVETRETRNGKTVASFSIAVDERFKGDNDQSASFFRVEAWGNAGSFASTYLSKGRLVAVSGRLKQEKWTDKDGAQRETYKVIADDVQGLDRPRDDQGGNQASDDDGDSDLFG